MPDIDFYDREVILTGTLPSYVYVLPVVTDINNVTVKLGSGSSPSPSPDTTDQYIAVTGAYLTIRIVFDSPDTIRKIVIFKIT